MRGTGPYFLEFARFPASADISTIVEHQRAGATDAEVLDFANSRGLIIVSHDVNTLKGEAEQ